ncbi:Murein DD-endopeptidase MepM and murein hydrolase activator NlpD, contain LysM domain [Desulfomicrobium norvegicum]|uniref:Murein DD-endopeptidase MepM and murein hydrolase activator NlpD, contain LysM domain n=1 Tax=Desulfomicrobium norvegicum (strain DSM 1741 / NCIMB 8310) TaxID=52561 RepID=A0A8G2F2W1_DESNO|nr:M23 family metallopeptidase [Desulfomicrobium norvegicum]SFL26193.1 Murein DD-endopeptidase MepM and murein hydrolase activator NlpD, contain LysM domain [Desulfomicrobium norvegicum]
MTKKNRHKIHRPANLSLKRKPAPSRLTMPFFAFMGALLIGAAIFFNFLSPNETQSSIDWSAQGIATRHEYQDIKEDGAFAEQEHESEELPEACAPREPEITRMSDTIKRGDTPSTLLEGHLGLSEIYSLCNESKDFYPLDSLRAGQPWTMIYSNKALIGLEYEIDSNERLVVSLTDSGYEFRREAIPYEMETKSVSGVVESSLFGAVTSAGESEELAIRLGNVFAYDVDFTRDLRTGDSFRVIVEKKFREGKFVGYGQLMAASFTNQGQTYHAYQYTDKKGNTAYYDEKGRPLRKAFLKSPLPFTRISSGYSMSRMHPILKYRRPHQGIDYAAPTGTPISTVADGIIAQVGSNKSQGRFVRVIHSNGYETIYNHMSKFAKASKKGAKVKQGQTIGYVGSTGYATGPHLDFRMRQNGKLINPLKLKTMPADPIASKEMPAFKAAVAAYMEQLEEPVQSASLEQPSTPNP